MPSLRLLSTLFLLVVSLQAQLRVATLNCFLLFKPGVEQDGQLADKEPLSPDDYRQKINNLTSLIQGADFVGLQEVGGRPEVEDLARAGSYRWAYAKGRDTYTGQEVGALYRLEGWQVRNNGRVAELDTIVSKHLLVTARRGSQRLAFLVVHLLRPIGKNAEKHQRQLDAIATWAAGQRKLDEGLSLVILGDTNNSSTPSGQTLFGPGKDAGEWMDYAPTHLGGKCFDRLVLIGPGHWENPFVNRPPYPKKPNDYLRRVWSDHYAALADLRLP